MGKTVWDPELEAFREPNRMGRPNIPEPSEARPSTRTTPVKRLGGLMAQSKLTEQQSTQPPTMRTVVLGLGQDITVAMRYPADTPVTIQRRET